MKYIIFDDYGEDGVIVFPKSMQHIDVAISLEITDRVKSAGFLMYRGADIACFGESVSLHVKAGVNDDKIVREALCN